MCEDWKDWCPPGFWCIWALIWGVCGIRYWRFSSIWPAVEQKWESTSVLCLGYFSYFRYMTLLHWALACVLFCSPIFCSNLGILCYWSGQLKPKVGDAEAVTPSAEHGYLYWIWRSIKWSSLAIHRRLQRATGCLIWIPYAKVTRVQSCIGLKWPKPIRGACWC